MTAAAETAPPGTPTKQRIDSIDLLRGLVMAIMALDHVRDFFHADSQNFSPEDLSRTTPLLFFTRWITHFCAPVFVFLAGVGIHFASPRRASKAQVSQFLITRGLWLIALEWTAMNFFFSFNFSSKVVLMQVLWATGWSMILMAGLIWVPRQAVLAFSMLVIAFHNAFDRVTPAFFGAFGWLWVVLHVPTFVPAGNHQIAFLYPVLPWMGVMAAGYCFGPIMQMEGARRRRTLAALGLSLMAAFLVVRYLNVYGDPRPWSPQSRPEMTVLSFFSANKYPPSLVYLLMTLGPAIFLLSFLDRVRVGADNFFRVLGRVPMFYYLLHFFSIHALAVIFGGLRYGNWTFFLQFPAKQLGMPAPGFPDDYGYSLGVTYLIWASLVIALYFPCRWYMHYKASHRHWWLSYL
jgi:uncharacterized membrane protein